MPVFENKPGMAPVLSPEATGKSVELLCISAVVTVKDLQRSFGFKKPQETF